MKRWKCAHDTTGITKGMRTSSESFSTSCAELSISSAIWRKLDCKLIVEYEVSWKDDNNTLYFQLFLLKLLIRVTKGLHFLWVFSHLRLQNFNLWGGGVIKSRKDSLISHWLKKKQPSFKKDSPHPTCADWSLQVSWFWSEEAFSSSNLKCQTT